MFFNRENKIRNPRVLSLLLSIGILTLTLALLWIGHWVKRAQDEQLIIREVNVVLPPPPPPPAPAVVHSNASNVPLQFNLQGAGASIQKIQLHNHPLPKFTKPDAPSVTTEQPEWQSLEVNWEAFNLDQLDGLPTLLTPLRVQFPKSLTRKGVHKVLVKLDVMIDETGQVSLINVVENSYPELKPEIDKMIRNSRFSVPKKGDVAVRARFIWPVEIKQS